jgi:hypothetical protein
MARLARREMIDPSEMQICHTISRCVRRAFLCGDDPVSGECYEHRRQWMHGQERNRPGPKSGWLSPVEANESSDSVGPDVCASGRRSSRKGFLPLSLGEYLELLDWTGRQLRGDKRGSIPSHLSPILQRIGLDAPDWCDLVKEFGRTFTRVAGTSEHLAEEANRRGQHWVQAPGNPLTVAS